MASNDEAQSPTNGYECTFVEEPPDELMCLICQHIARDPLQHGDGGCGKIFCRGCITEWQKKKNQCPNCREELATFKDNRSERNIQSLRVRCENEKEGCQWVGELRSLDQHLKICGYVKVLCPNRCEIIIAESFVSGRSYENEYVKQVFRKDLYKHLQEECPHRQYTCPHCKETGEYAYIAHIHHNTCPKLEIDCPNEECKTSFPREDKQAHLSVCPYQKVVCKYQEFGCQVEPLRKDLTAHEGDDKTHLRMTMDTLLATRRELRATKRELKERLHTHIFTVNNLSQNCFTTRDFVFKLPKFTEKMENDIEYFSPSFFTHPQGYKMIICIDANGYGDSEGTHVSVWVWLMRGEYDDQLEFPFKGTITFELLNQLEDNNHHKCSYTHDGTEDGSERVTEEERAGMAHGAHNFIPHSQLGYDAAKNCQYLKDDCLVFHIYAEVPSYKPWLQCTTTN